MSWLACMEVDAETAFEALVGHEKSNGYGLDNYGLHRLLWRCFPGEPDRKRDFLTRIDTLEGAFRL